MTERRRRKEPIKNNIAEQFKESANGSPAPRKIDELLIPTGSTMLNCCCSDNPFGGFQLGKIVTLPGPSQSGKSIIAMSVFAGMAHNPAFDGYDLIYDDIEEAMEFDTTYLFGKKTSKRVQPPGYDKDKDPLYSNTVQDLESNILLRCNQGNCKPFVWIADSLDGLTEEEEIKKEFENAIIRAKDGDHAEKIKEAFAANRAYVIGRTLRQIKGYLKKTKSTMIMIQQERTNVGAKTFQKQYTTSGGKAPFYYSSHQVRLVNTGAIYGANKISIGNKLDAQVVKNKLNGKKRQCSFCVYEDMGVDDVSSCVDYLCKNYWKSVPDHPQTFRAEELNFEGTKIKIIEHIENDALEKTMQEVVGVVWNLNEESLRLGRSRRF